jgi:hypothetical protein
MIKDAEENVDGLKRLTVTGWVIAKQLAKTDLLITNDIIILTESG